ncbi:mechanosensitive ion channel family protein [Rubrobacter calidifluminis]|uniref:mechanosensitive ion channel family protein n=1 Tax=Rubrobacter calidifluminis TaxID=1392640 RepID=UPI002362AC68|nr:mechanosensitive ion channel family protein [Rubrobacter calidifluminis]
MFQAQTSTALGDAATRRLQGAGGLAENLLDYLKSSEFVGNVISAVALIVLAALFYRLASGLIPRLFRLGRPSEEEALDEAGLARIKRQDTAITLARNILRYSVFGTVALIILSIFLRQTLPAVAGASVLAAIIGFGAQSFLRDIIAGFFILFEGQYGVGDFVRLEPTKISGLVEEFGLRTTKLRTPSGEEVFIPNGSILGVTNYVSGQQRFIVEVLLRDAGAAARVLDSLSESAGLYVIPPRLVSREDRDGMVRLRIRAGVLPSTEWIVREGLVERIKAAAGEDALLSDPLVYDVDSASLGRIRHLIPRSGQP